ADPSLITLDGMAKILVVTEAARLKVYGPQTQIRDVAHRTIFSRVESKISGASRRGRSFDIRPPFMMTARVVGVMIVFAMTAHCKAGKLEIGISEAPPNRKIMVGRYYSGP